MKVTKTVKYNYKLTEENLEKDIDRFIEEARKGFFNWDRKQGSLGLKIIKQYFKLLEKKFNNKEYEECKICYEKLILFLIDSSIGIDNVDLGYEDLLWQVDKNFDRFIKNYFICLVKTCEINELTEHIADYAIRIERAGYGFDSDMKILIEELNEQTLKNLEQRLLVKTEGMTKKDEDKIDIIYFLMEMA
ncbi:MAG: hypothetical protein ACOCUU_03170, partial [Nanoarchaeota archaeon]